MMVAHHKAEDYIKNIQCEGDKAIIKMRDDSSLANATWGNNIPTIIGLDNNKCSFISPLGTKIIPPFNIYYKKCDITIIQPEGGDAIATMRLHAKNALEPQSLLYTFTAICTYPHVTIST